MFQFIQNENEVHGLAKNAAFKVGISDVDRGNLMERSFSLPAFVDPEFSWMVYSCYIETWLDAGMVLHKILPVADYNADTLGAGELNSASFSKLKNGVNWKSNGSYTDVVQRMGTSDYRFVVKGYALRAGWPIPVPFLKTMGKLTPYPDKKQWVHGNEIVANYAGVQTYFNQWELWYFVAAAPNVKEIVPNNLAQFIGQVDPVKAIQPAISQPDQNAQPTGPQQLLQGVRR